MSYADVLLRHFHQPRNQRVMDSPDVVGVAGFPGQGPYLVLYLRIEDDRILEAAFQTHGCAPSIAAGSLLATELPGATLTDALVRWTEVAIHEALGGLPPHKRHCSALAAGALARAAQQSTPSAPPRIAPR